jgi:UDP-N-acetylglucosamine 1-carboxyvinyltransferase
LACVTAHGKTVLENAAIEPEVDSLAEFLAKCGASIRGIGTRTLEIQGVDRLRAAPFSVIPDRIEAGTFLAAAAITGGDLKVTGCRPDHLEAVLQTLREAGSTIETGRDFVRCKGALPPKGFEVTTSPYPGFPTDMQAQMMAVASIGEGVSRLTDTIYTDRFKHVSELVRLGADVRLDGNTATVTPVPGLSGAKVMASDLRASAALIVAGLVAKGETHVSRVYHIDRGYERIEEKLRAVGAKIQRVREEGP